MTRSLFRNCMHSCAGTIGRGRARGIDIHPFGPALAAMLALVLAMTVPASAQHYITIDATGAGTNQFQGTQAWGINALGWVDGTFFDVNQVYHGFVRDPGGHYTVFDAPGSGTGMGQGTVGQGINIQGAITGQYFDGANVAHGFVRAADGTITTFDAPGAGASGTSGDGGIGTFEIATYVQGTYPESINNLGEIAGFYIDSNWVWHGFVRDPKGKIATFDAPGAGTIPYTGTFVNFTSRSLNAAGVLADFYIDNNYVYHGYLRTPDGKITEFDAPGTGTAAGQGTIPSSINIEGVISGICVDSAGVWHGCQGTPKGVFTTYSAPAALATFGEDINNFGVATGMTDDGTGRHGYVRTANGILTEFDVPGSLLITQPESIGDGGVVAGWYWDQNLAFHGFVRLPY